MTRLNICQSIYFYNIQINLQSATFFLSSNYYFLHFSPLIFFSTFSTFLTFTVYSKNLKNRQNPMSKMSIFVMIFRYVQKVGLLGFVVLYIGQQFVAF